MDRWISRKGGQKILRNVKFTTCLPESLFLASLPPFATSPEHLGGQAAQKCGWGKHVVNFTLLIIFWSLFLGLFRGQCVQNTRTLVRARIEFLSEISSFKPSVNTFVCWQARGTKGRAQTALGVVHVQMALFTQDRF